MPAQIDFNQSAGQILGQANNFAGSNYNTQANWNPSLTQLNLGNYSTALLGNIDSQAFLQQHPEFQDGFNQAGANGSQWLQSAIQNAGYINPSSVPRSGGAAQLAGSGWAAANPGLAQYTGQLGGVMDQLNQRAPGNQYASGYFASQSGNTQAGPAASATYNPATGYTSQTNRANGGPLLGGLQQNAAQSLGTVSPLQGQLNQQASSLLSTNGGLSPAEMMQTQQNARAAYSDRGLLRSNRGVGAEILATDQAQRQRLMENAQFAQGVDQSGQAQLNANRGYALNVQGQGQNLSQFNAGQGNQVGLANAGMLNNAGQFNSGLGAQTSQFNAGQQNNMGQFNASLLQNNNQFNTGQNNQANQFNTGATNNFAQFNAGLQQQNNADAWNRAMQYGNFQMGQAQNPQGLAQGLSGQTPDYTNSLLNYGNSVNQFNAGAQNQSSLQHSQNNTSLFNTGLGLLFCWVAREVYGAENPRWLAFRSYMRRHSPAKLFATYAKHGPALADRVRAEPALRAQVRAIMDRILAQDETFNPSFA